MSEERLTSRHGWVMVSVENTPAISILTMAMAAAPGVVMIRVDVDTTELSIGRTVSQVSGDLYRMPTQTGTAYIIR